jgi:hypothetical protein
MIRLAFAGCLAFIWGGASAAGVGDRHAGYYYPHPGTSEVYEARPATLPDSNRRRRIGFVTELTNQSLARAYPPQFVIFAKGTHAQKLIITGLASGSVDTLFRMRALLAQLTARARSTPIFRDFQAEDVFTFLDLLKLLGFEQLTVTDGDRFAHQIVIR